MDSEIFKHDPTRRPQWRLDYVMELIGNRPRPRPPRRCSDDQYIQAYYRLVTEYDTTDERRREVLEYLPHIYQAHCLYHSADAERRQILEARLLTGESDEEIARHFGTTAEVVESYEKLFFNVRDRLQCSDWIHLTTLRRPAAGAANENGALSDEERGSVYHWVGYYGGPLVLDAVINVVGPIKAPQRGAELGAWMDEAFGQVVRTRAALAASPPVADNRDAMRSIRLAGRQRKAAKDRSEVPDAARAKQMCAVLEPIISAMAGKMPDVRRAD
jgi:hypothetical protein